MANGNFALANEDIKRGLKQVSLALNLAMEDLRDRYARTLIGIFWITVGFLLFLGVKALVFEQLNLDLGQNFLLYLTIGFAIWSLLLTVITESATSYTRNAGWMLSTDLPYSLYFFKGLFRALLEFTMIALAAAIIVAATAEIYISGLVSIVPALFLYIVTAFGLNMIIAPLATRFRDITFLIQSFMRVAFFATPIIWIPREGTILETLAIWNPFAHYINLIRVPLMTGELPTMSWVICCMISVAIISMGYCVFSATRQRVILWL